jgi:hypothetical protein
MLGDTAQETTQVSLLSLHPVLFRVILYYLLIAIIAVSGINIVEIATTLAPFLVTPWFFLNGEPHPALSAVGGIRKVLQMAPRTDEADVEAGSALFTEFRVLLIGGSTVSTFHGEYPINCSPPLGEEGKTIPQ